MDRFARWLLSLPGGIHFWKLILTLVCEEGLLHSTPLVEGCSQTLEYLDISCEHFGMFIRRPISIGLFITCLFLAESRSTLIDLSKAAGLKDVVFRVGPKSVGWVTTALHTITPKHRNLRRISICMPRDLALGGAGSDIIQSLGEAASRRWSDLDRLLVKFWESRSIRPRVGYELGLAKNQENMDYSIGRLLPEVTKRGIVDPI